MSTVRDQITSRAPNNFDALAVLAYQKKILSFFAHKTLKIVALQMFSLTTFVLVMWPDVTPIYMNWFDIRQFYVHSKT